MKTLTNEYNFTLHAVDCLDGHREPAMEAERQVDRRIREQWKAAGFARPDRNPGVSLNRPTFKGEFDRVMYAPWSAFRKPDDRIQTRADVGGTAWSYFASIKPSYTTGLIGHSAVYKAGATVWEGLTGQVTLTGTTTIPLPAFSANTDETSQSVNFPPVFTGGSVGGNSLILSPLRLSAKIPVSKQLILQGAELFDSVLREQISRGISGMLDNLALFGTGSSGQPLGVFAAVTPWALGGTPMTWANYQTWRTSILASDLDPDSFGGILSPMLLNYLDQTQAYSGASFSIWEKMQDGHPDRFFVGNEVNAGTGMATTTTQSGTLTNGQSTVTGLTSTAGLYVGQPVSGTNVPANTTIAAVTSGTGITLSANATGTGAQTLTFTSAKGLFLGLWRFLYLLTWTDGIEIVFDQYSSADTNETIVRANILANIGITFPGAFGAYFQS